MIRAAVLRNPRSTRNIGRDADAVPDGCTLVHLDDLSTLTGALEAVIRDRIELLIIDGGDGTVREILSRLGQIPGPRPLIGIVPHGNTNLVARKIGAIRDLVAIASANRSELAAQSRQVPVLEIEIDAEPPVVGFITGWGAYAAGTRIAQEELAARGSRQIVWAVLSTVWRALFGRNSQSLRAGTGMGVQIDATQISTAPSFLGLATALNGRLAAGLKPFWGAGTGAIRWLDVAAPARRLWLAGPLAAFGAHLPMFERLGYRSGRAAQITLSDLGEIVIDGEVFPVPSRSDVRISAGNVFNFVVN